MKSKNIFAVLALAIALTMTINVASAAVPYAIVANVNSCDIAGTPKTEFGASENVYIQLTSTSPAGDKADVVVTRDSDSAVIASYPGLVAVSAVLDLGTLSPGTYTVTANGALVKTIAVATFFVVPESILGTLTATVAGFAAFATIGIVKRKHAKSK